MLNFSSCPPPLSTTTPSKYSDTEELEEGEILEDPPPLPQRKHSQYHNHNHNYNYNHPLPPIRHYNPPYPSRTNTQHTTTHTWRQDPFLNEEKAFVDMILRNPKLALQHLRNSPLSPHDIIGLFLKFKQPVPDILQAMCDAMVVPSPSPFLVRQQPEIAIPVPETKVEEAESDDMEIEGDEEDTNFTGSILPLGPWITTTTPEKVDSSTSIPLENALVAENIGKLDSVFPRSHSVVVEPVQQLETPKAIRTLSAETVPTLLSQTPVNTNPSTPTSFVPFSFPSRRPVSSKGNGFSRQPHSMVIDLSFSDEEEDPNDHVTRFLRACRDAASVSAEAKKDEDEAKAKKRQEEEDAKAKETRQTLEEKERDIQLMKARIEELQRSKKRISSSSVDVASPSTPTPRAIVRLPNGSPDESDARPAIPPPTAPPADTGSPAIERPRFPPIGEISVEIRADLDARAAELRAQLLKKLPGTALSLSRSDSPEPAPNTTAPAEETEQVEPVTEPPLSERAPVPSDASDGDVDMQRYMTTLSEIEREQANHIASVESLKSLIEDLNKKQSEAQQKLKALEEEEEKRLQRKRLVERLVRINEKRSKTPQRDSAESVPDASHVATVTDTAEPMEGLELTSEAVDSVQPSNKRPPSPPDESSHRVIEKKAKVSNGTASVATAKARSKDQEIAELEAAMRKVQNEQADIRKAAEQRRRTQIEASSLLKYPKLESVLSGKRLADPIPNAVQLPTLSDNIVPREAIEPTTIELVVRGGYLQKESSLAVLSDLHPSVFDPAGQHSTNSDKRTQAANEPSKHPKYDSFRPYVSAISNFRNVENSSNPTVEGFRSATQTSKLNPIQKLCIYETSGGECNDDACTSQHFRNVDVTDDDLLASLASRIPISFWNDESRYLEELREVVRKAQMEDKASPADLLKAITEYQKSRGGHATEAPVSGPSGDTATIQPQPTNSDEAAPASATVGAAPQSSTGNDAIVSVMLKVPVVVDGLVKLLEGESDSKGRYFAASLSEDDYKERVERDPADTVVWLNWAASQLPDGIDAGTLARPGLALDRAILILSKCLRHHHRSESVWLFYMELLCRRGKDVKIRMMFQKALEYTRHSPTIAWRFYQWEPEEDLKLGVLQEMLRSISNHTMTCSTRCELAMSILLQMVHLKAGYKSVMEAKKMHFHLLTCKDSELFEAPSAESSDRLSSISCLSENALFKILRPEDIAAMWLAYLHLLAYDRLPSALFHSSPYEYHVRQPALFEIVWPEEAMKEESRRNEIASVLDSLIAKWPEVVDNKDGMLPSTLRASARTARGGIWRNFVAFAKFSGRLDQVEDTVEGWTKSYPGLPEGCDLRADICVERGNVAEAKRRLSDLAMGGGLGFAGLWNRLVKLVIQQYEGSEASTAISEILSSAIRSCFELEDATDSDTVYNVETALDMYRYVLGVGTPSVLEMPALRNHFDKRAMRGSVHVWLNYMILQRLQFSSTQDVRAMFTQALEALKETEDRELIWKEWIRYESTADGTSLLSTKPQQDLLIAPVLLRAAQDLKYTQPYPYSTTVSAENESDWMKMTPISDFTNLDRILSVALMALTPTKASDILNSIHQRYPNSIPVCLRAINDDVRHSTMRQARSRIWALIRRYPALESLWRVALRLEIRNARTTSAIQNICTQAALFLPPNSVSAIKAEAQLGDAGTGHAANQVGEC